MSGEGFVSVPIVLNKDCHDCGEKYEYEVRLVRICSADKCRNLEEIICRRNLVSKEDVDAACSDIKKCIR